MKSKLFIFLLIIILLISGGYLVWISYGQDIIDRYIITPTPTPTLAPEPTTPTDIGVLEQPEDLSNWKQSTTGEYYPWTFKYPSAWKEESDNMDLAFSYVPKPRVGTYSVHTGGTNTNVSNIYIDKEIESYFTENFYYVTRYEIATLPKYGNKVYIVERMNYSTPSDILFQKEKTQDITTTVLIENSPYRYRDINGDIKCINNGTLFFSTVATSSSQEEITNDPYFDTLKQIVSTVEFLPCTD